MIGIDTNILLRLWLNDDPSQDKRIDPLLAKHGSAPGSLLVTDLVLVEAVWSARSAFDQDKHAQLIAVRSLLEETAFAFEDREAIAEALGLFEAGTCGFADCLVIAKHALHHCEFTATFDRGMRKLPGVKVLWLGQARGWRSECVKPDPTPAAHPAASVLPETTLPVQRDATLKRVNRRRRCACFAQRRTARRGASWPASSCGR